MAQTRFFSIDDLSHLPKPAWMIEGIFERNSLAMLAGPPGGLKSFMAIDWMLSLATGRKWNDKTVSETKVLYVLGEGKSSLLNRIETWALYHKITAGEREKLVSNFRVTFDVPQMAIKPSVDNMLASLETSGYTPQLICIDTFARSFVGLDENSQKDTGMWVEQAERLRALGFTVLFLHHTAKNTEFGHSFRGSSVILGAMDTAILQVRESETKVMLKVKKQKDHDEGPAMHFTRLILNAKSSDDGSCVLVPSEFQDERFSEDHAQMEAIMAKLLKDPTFVTDKARAEVLANEFAIPLGSAQTKLSRYKNS